MARGKWKQGVREIKFAIRMSYEEKEELKRRASLAGTNVANFVRNILGLKCSLRKPVEKKSEKTE